MQIQAKWKNGALHPVQPLTLRHHLITIEVPDEELVPAYTLPTEVKARAKEMEKRLDQIRNAPLPDAETLPPLTPKQLDRIDAFALREEVRKERGHTA